jgi:hypothetical protein
MENMKIGKKGIVGSKATAEGRKVGRLKWV